MKPCIIALMGFVKELGLIDEILHQNKNQVKDCANKDN